MSIMVNGDGGFFKNLLSSLTLLTLQKNKNITDILQNIYKFVKKAKIIDMKKYPLYNKYIEMLYIRKIKGEE